MARKAVIWLGGPDDGETIMLDEWCNHLVIAVSETTDEYVSEYTPFGPMSFRKEICEVVKTPRGLRLIYPYLKINKPIER